MYNLTEPSDIANVALRLRWLHEVRSPDLRRMHVRSIPAAGLSLKIQVSVEGLNAKTATYLESHFPLTMCDELQASNSIHFHVVLCERQIQVTLNLEYINRRIVRLELIG
jgi:hypothetical protein